MQRKEDGYYISDEELKTTAKITAIACVGIMILRAVFQPVVVVSKVK